MKKIEPVFRSGRHEVVTRRRAFLKRTEGKVWEEKSKSWVVPFTISMNDMKPPKGNKNDG